MRDRLSEPKTKEVRKDLCRIFKKIFFKKIMEIEESFETEKVS